MAVACMSKTRESMLELKNIIAHWISGEKDRVCKIDLWCSSHRHTVSATVSWWDAEKKVVIKEHYDSLLDGLKVSDFTVVLSDYLTKWFGTESCLIHQCDIHAAPDRLLMANVGLYAISEEE